MSKPPQQPSDNRSSLAWTDLNTSYLQDCILVEIAVQLNMNPSTSKRPVTQILVEGLPLLNKPSTDAQVVVSTLPEPKSELAEGPNPTTRLAKRNTSPSPAEPSRKIIHGQPRSLALLKISKGENTTGSDLIEQKESQWDIFKKIFKYDLAGMVSICVRHSSCHAV